MNQVRSSHINIKTINKYLVSLSVIVLALYVFAVNSLAIAGFALADYKNQLEAIKRDNKNLEVKITNISSYSYLGEKIKKLDLVPVGEIRYLNPINTTVAKK